MNLDPSRVAAAIPRDARIVRAGLSGGVDSVVLLHVLAKHLPPEQQLEAIHVHHGLQPGADDWASHCRALCDKLGVRCTVRYVHVGAGDGAGVEAQARALRYRALCEDLSETDVLVTAHHADDQAETVLLQLLRGAGVRGLAAMARHGIAPGTTAVRLVRPLLDVDRAAIESWARRAGLDWVEDPTNAESTFDRSYLRREVMPRLRARWPAMSETMARSARLCAEAAGMLDCLAQADLAGVQLAGEAVSVAGLLLLSPARRRNALRAWIASRNLPPPHAAHLRELEETILPAASDAVPCMRWPGAEVRRYRDAVYAMAPLAPAPGKDIVLEWSPPSRLVLPSGCGELIPAVAGATLPLPSRRLSVRFRRGGERLRLRADGPAHTVKKLMQDAGVPPWVRERMPFVYHGERLLCVADRWVAAPDEAMAARRSVEIAWLNDLPGAMTEQVHEHSG